MRDVVAVPLYIEKSNPDSSIFFPSVTNNQARICGIAGHYTEDTE